MKENVWAYPFVTGVGSYRKHSKYMNTETPATVKKQ